MRANILLVIAAVLWGMAFVAQKEGSEHVGTFSFNAIRFALGAGVIGLVVMVLDRRRRIAPVRRRELNRSVLLPGLICGAMLTGAVSLQQAAMPDTTAGNASFVTSLYLVLVPILGLVLGIRPRWPALAGVVLAVTGLYFIAFTDSFSLGRGDGLAMISAICFAAQILAVDRYAGRLPALRFAASQFWFCALISAAAALIFEAAPFSGIEPALIPLLYGGLISVGLAYTFQVMAQRDAEPTGAALIMSLEAVFGAVGGALILDEDMGARGYFGAALMLAGIVLSQIGPPPRPTKTTRPHPA
jgi:drug/metabolite transporter (DMT)-like permease